MTSPPDASRSDSASRLAEYRNAVRNHEPAVNTLAGLRSARRAYVVMVLASSALAALLAYSVVVALWNTQPTFTRYFGLTATLVVAAIAGRLTYKNRPKLTDADLDVRNAAYDKQTAAALLPLDSPEALRIYRESTLDLVDSFRIRATRNRRIHNSIQAIIIVASILASTSTALTGEFDSLRWIATGLSATVGIAAGLTAYFKFRERGQGLQTTADDIDKHYTAAQFRLDDFASDKTEEERLLRFARYVEKLKEEQRKRELQLEQSPERTEERGG